MLREISCPVQAEAQLGSGVMSKGRQFFLGRVWAKKGKENVNE
jgi:hypothetical protein